MLLVFMSRGFVRRPFQPLNCSCSRVHFSIQFKYTIAVQVLSLFFSSHLFPSVAIFILNLFFFFLCHVSRQQPHSFDELKFSSIFSPFINRLAKALVFQILMTRIVKEHQYFIV